MENKIFVSKAPRVYLVGQTSVNLRPLTAFLAQEADACDWWPGGTFTSSDVLPEVGGRICYMSFKSMLEGKGRKTNKEYLTHIKSVGHGSVLEHTSFNFIFCGVSRTLTHELVRHRVGTSFSELSQRYVFDGGFLEVVMPPEFINDKDSNIAEKILFETFDNALCGRNNLEANLLGDKKYSSKTMGKKRKNQALRSVLPNDTGTKIMMTMNARALRHFLEARGSIGADLEIRRLALAVYNEVSDCNLFDDFEIVKVDGEPVDTLVAKYKRV